MCQEGTQKVAERLAQSDRLKGSFVFKLHTCRYTRPVGIGLQLCYNPPLGWPATNAKSELSSYRAKQATFPR